MQWLFPVVAGLTAVLLGGRYALSVPDAALYRELALGQRQLVPAPFAARVLGPALAAWLGRMTARGVDFGFLALGLASLALALALIFLLLRARRVSTGLMAAVFLMPLWSGLFHAYYLPDLLHAALISAMLGCLAAGWSTAAMLLILPAFLARESTILVAVCLLLTAWRDIPLRAKIAGMLATLAGIGISRHFLALAAGNVHGLTGGTYIGGKVLWGFFREVLGLPLWSNTLPECAPVWTAPLPAFLARHLGAIRTVGICGPRAYGPSRVVLGVFGVFGLGPAVAALLLRRNWQGWAPPLSANMPRTSAFRHPAARIMKMFAPLWNSLPKGHRIVLRFSILYGTVSLLLGPVLGASTDRLVAYAWPLFLVGLPWMVTDLETTLPADTPRLLDRRNFGMLLLHLLTCWIAWYGFQQQQLRGYLLCGAAVLALNLFAHARLRRAGVWQAVPVASAVT